MRSSDPLKPQKWPKQSLKTEFLLNAFISGHILRLKPENNALTHGVIIISVPLVHDHEASNFIINTKEHVYVTMRVHEKVQTKHMCTDIKVIQHMLVYYETDSLIVFNLSSVIHSPHLILLNMVILLLEDNFETISVNMSSKYTTYQIQRSLGLKINDIE